MKKTTLPILATLILFFCFGMMTNVEQAQASLTGPYLPTEYPVGSGKIPVVDNNDNMSYYLDKTVFLLDKDDADQGYPNFESWLTVELVPNDPKSAYISWDLTGTEFSAYGIVLKDGQRTVPGAIDDIFWIYYEVNDDQRISSMGKILVSTNQLDSLGYDGGAISHVSLYGVPIPAAAWLLGTGLVGLVAVRRRMKK